MVGPPRGAATTIAESPRFSTHCPTALSETAPKARATAPANGWPAGDRGHAGASRHTASLDAPAAPSGNSPGMAPSLAPPPGVRGHHRTPIQHRWTGSTLPRRRANQIQGTRQNTPATFGKRGTRRSRRVSHNREQRLFTKNTGLCKVVTPRIGSEACPVLVL